MGQMLFVLTTKLEGKQGYGPVAVTDDEHTANEWVRAGNDNDWIPLELNDLSTTSLGRQPTTFKPVAPKKRNEQTVQQVEQTRQNIQQTNKLLEEALKKKKLFSSARTAGRHDELKKHYEERAQDILMNGYLQDRAEYEQDPKIYDFLDYLKTEFRANVPEDEYEILVDVLYAAYRKMFGDK